MVANPVCDERSQGRPTGVKASDLLAAPFEAGAALRHRRLFHPTGVLADGALERLAPPGTGLPVESCAVVARVSKGLGTPGRLPDFAGLAWRMPPTAFSATPWDVLLVSAGLSAGQSVTNRVLLRPVVSWSQAPYCSLMPLSYEGPSGDEHSGDQQLWWVRARLRTPIGSAGLSLSAFADRINDGGVRFEVEQARGTGDFQPLAHITLTGLHDGDVWFDPVRHSAPGVRLWPQWLREVRATTYRSSREGRDR